METKKDYALFDLDQTLIPWDSQLLFRNYVLQQEGGRRIFTLVFLAFTPLFKLLGAGTMKRIFHCYLWRMPHPQLEEYARSFVHQWLPKITYPEILAEAEQHRREGKILVLASASPELWVRPIGEQLGFDLSLGTRFDWGETTPFFPDLIGENHKGTEKVRRLAELGITDGSAGYSDSRADIPMLRLCQHNTMVNPLPSFRKEGLAQGWRLMEPARPWKGRLSFAWGCFLQLWGIFPLPK